MSNMYKVVKSLCDEHHISIKKLSEEIGVSNSIFTELKQGRTKDLSRATLEKIAMFFKVTPDELRLAAMSANPDWTPSRKEKARDEDKIAKLLGIGPYNRLAVERWRLVGDDELMQIFWSGMDYMDKDDLDELRRYAGFMAESKLRRIEEEKRKGAKKE